MTGYRELAHLMTKCPELAIVRQFRAMGAKNLLYLQAELLYLEDELNEICRLDGTMLQRQTFDTWWKRMHDASTDDDSDRQRKKVDEMQLKIRQYYEMVVLTAQVQKLPAPNPRNLSTLRECLNRGDDASKFLRDVEGDAWQESNTTDLVVLSSEGISDGLGMHLDAVLTPCFHRLFGSRSPPTAEGDFGRIWLYKGKHLAQLGNFVCILISAGINAASVVAMNVVADARTRLLMMGLFCFAFAVAMSLFAAGRRVDLFAATTAFAAVQAVFAGGANIMPGCATS